MIIIRSTLCGKSDAMDSNTLLGRELPYITVDAFTPGLLHFKQSMLELSEGASGLSEL